MNKPWLKIGVIGGLSLFVLVLGGGLVFAKQPHQDQSAAQPYTKSNANNRQEKAQVLGAATNNDMPTPRSHPSQAQQKSAEVSTSTPASSSSSGTTSTSTQTDSMNVHTHEIGVLNISIQTDVGGQACGFPNGFCKWEYSANVVVKDNTGQVVASSSSASSSHTFNLPAGKYTVYAQYGDGAHVAPGPVTVDINYSGPTDITLFYEPLAVTN